MIDLRHQPELLLERLRAAFPNATYELDWQSPEQLLVATILAAQCTDERVNRVTPALFARFPTPAALAEADQSELEQLIEGTGFFRQKAQRIREVMGALVRDHDGEVPRSMLALTRLPGVARKTANVVLNCAFDLPSGVIVDTHVQRVAGRMGLSRQEDPDAIERDLMQVLPREAWTFGGPALVLHGRYVCTAKAPRCADCPFLDVCPRHGVEGARPAPSHGGPSVDGWVLAMADTLDQPWMLDLLRFVEQERQTETVYPCPEHVFAAFDATPFESVKVVILGQDPYHGEGQAHGLAFSVPPGEPAPPSLRNVLQELERDVGVVARGGDLRPWTGQGVLLLNTVLTVRAGKPNSHAQHGWERFTDAVIRKLSATHDHLVFLLWGAAAGQRSRLIDASRHTILSSAHPSPLASRHGFAGSRPFSRINDALVAHGQSPVDWGTIAA